MNLLEKEWRQTGELESFLFSPLTLNSSEESGLTSMIGLQPFEWHLAQHVQSCISHYTTCISHYMTSHCYIFGLTAPALLLAGETLLWQGYPHNKLQSLFCLCSSRKGEAQTPALLSCSWRWKNLVCRNTIVPVKQNQSVLLIVRLHLPRQSLGYKNWCNNPHGQFQL